MQRITLIDVARAAGVSTASASRALSGREGVTPELHARIMAAAGRLGYRAHWAARALASDHSGLVGVAVFGATASGLELLRVLERSLDQADYGCLIAFAAKAGVTSLDGLIERGSEALAFVGRGPLPQEMEALGKHALPWIAIAEDGDGDPRRMELGQAAGAELATRYLLELNHERFAVLGASDGGTARGVARALEGSAVSGAVSFQEAYGPEDDLNMIKRAVHGWLDLARPPTAIVCGNDGVALTCVRECSLRGVRVPTDISIVGFGDEPFARAALPSLTTVRSAVAPIGLHAVEALKALLAGRVVEPYRPVVKLAVRETTGPAP